MLQAVPPRTVLAGETIRVRLVADDPDQGDILTFFLDGGPSSAILQDGVFVAWTPTTMQGGIHAFSVRVQDLAGAADSGNFSVEVITIGANVPPQLDPLDDAVTSPGTLFARTIAAHDPDPADTLTFALLDGPAGLALTPAGALTWTPTLGQLGSHLVKLQVSDLAGATDAGMFSIAVEVPAAVGPPVANDDRYAVRGGTSLVVPAAGVLANDVDPAGQPLAAQLVDPPSRGSVSLQADGGFTYTPAVPAAGSTEPQLAFALNRSADVNFLDSVRSGPYVADLDGDGRPEIVYVASGQFATRRLEAVRGDGTVKWSVNAVSPVPLAIGGGRDIALGDLDGDGTVEIIAVEEDAALPLARRLAAFNHDGTLRWVSDDVVDGITVASSTGIFAPAIADLDGNGLAEILVHHRGAGPAPNDTNQDYLAAFNHEGKLLWQCRGSGFVAGTFAPVVVDLDLDGKPEIIFSNDVCDHQGNLLWSISVPRRAPRRRTSRFGCSRPLPGSGRRRGRSGTSTPTTSRT